jgi:isopentenyl-diphosphate Delta-isomerase
LPEMGLKDVQLDSELFGKKLRHPFIVAGMTGGTERAAQVNMDLASVAEHYGLAFGVGSQRAMSENPELGKTFQVRQVAPTCVVIGNVGLGQAIEMGEQAVQRLAEAIGADGMALHLNAGQELTQPEGGRDFTGGYRAVEKLARSFPGRFLVKETGCGISPQVARRLVEAGVQYLDVSGLGGTSWVRVEELRSKGIDAEVGRAFSGWGIPTAAAVASVRQRLGEGVRLVASGGIRNGLEAAKALALGADWVAMALPLFRAQQQGGWDRVSSLVEELVGGLQRAMVLTGSRTALELRQRPMALTGALKDWLAAL